VPATNPVRASRLNGDRDARRSYGRRTQAATAELFEAPGGTYNCMIVRVQRRAEEATASMRARAKAASSSTNVVIASFRRPR
jgi:hypothetical protein